MNMVSKIPKIVITVFLLALCASPALAVPIVYSGYDVGAGSLAASPNATGAAANFDSATTASVIDFESALPTGVSISGGATQNVSGGAALFGYNTTSGGSYFRYVLGEEVTLTFDDPINAFGAYFTGWQVGSQTITYVDSSTVTLTMPNGDMEIGGTLFYGFIDTDVLISSIAYNAQNDIVAVDDIRYSAAGGTPSNPVPEPATLLLLGSGIIAFAGFRKKNKSS